jgi:uncharacterized paraquat-inducible protein A
MWWTTMSETVDGECHELRCPKCGCEKIVARTLNHGDEARCWECGHEFVITQKCWALKRPASPATRSI